MTRPVVIITRPLEDSERLARRLEQVGCACVIAPLIGIEPVIADDLPQVDLQAVVFTSANGVRGLMAQPDARRFLQCPAVAVGPASAACARAAGFSTVFRAGGDVAAVIDSIRARFKPDGGVIFYPSGLHLAGDLCGELTASGYCVARSVVYKAVHAAELPEPATKRLAAGGPVAVCLYSPRTARIWCDNLYDLMKDKRQLPNLRYFCLSANVARVLRDQLGGSVTIDVAETPDDEGMVDLVRDRLGVRG